MSRASGSRHFGIRGISGIASVLTPWRPGAYVPSEAELGRRWPGWPWRLRRRWCGRLPLVSHAQVRQRAAKQSNLLAVGRPVAGTLRGHGGTIVAFRLLYERSHVGRLSRRVDRRLRRRRLARSRRSTRGGRARPVSRDVCAARCRPRPAQRSGWRRRPRLLQRPRHRGRRAICGEDEVESGRQRLGHDDPILMRNDDAVQFGNLPPDARR